VARALSELGRRAGGRREGLLIAEVNGAPAHETFMGLFLTEAGFTASAQGFHLLRRSFDVTSPREALLASGAGEPDA
jgi:hypothetical protein